MRFASFTCIAFTTALVLGVLGCGPAATGPPRLFNDAGFPGAQADGRWAVDAVTFEYRFSTRAGETLVRTNCPDTLATSPGAIAPRHYQRFRHLRIRCLALQRFTHSHRATRSYLSDRMSLAVIRRLPAVAVPLVNDEERARRVGRTLGETAPGLETEAMRGNLMRVRTAHDRLTYRILAKADFDGDGLQDWLVTVTREPIDGLGGRSDLVQLTRKAPDAALEMTWRME